MPFLLFLILAGLLASSAALRTECVGLVGDLWDFGNRWLRRLIIGMALWPTIMVAVAGIGPLATFTVGPWATAIGIALGVAALIAAIMFLVAAVGARRWIIPVCCLIVAAVCFTMASMNGNSFTLINSPAIALLLGFVPTIVLVAAWAQQPMLLAVPSVVNGTERVIEQILGSVPAPKKFKPAVKLPRIPDAKKILWPLAAFAVVSLLLGIYLYYVEVSSHRMLLVVLLALGLAIAWLSVFGKWKKLRGMLQFAMVILTVYIYLGGHVKAGETISTTLSKFGGSDRPHPNTVCGSPVTEADLQDAEPSAAAAVAGAAAVQNTAAHQVNDLHNAFGIKFIPPATIVKRYGGEDSGEPMAPDVGGKVYNRAKFPTVEDGREAVKDILRSDDYPRLTVHQTLKQYTTGKPDRAGGYGMDAITRNKLGDRLNGNQSMRDIIADGDKFNLLVDLIQKEETGTGPLGVAVPLSATSATVTTQPARPASKQTLADLVIHPHLKRVNGTVGFIVEFPGDVRATSCFSDFYQVPFNHWAFQPIDSTKPEEWWVSLWFLGASQPEDAYFFYKDAEPHYMHHPLTMRFAGKPGDKILVYRE